MDPHLAGSWRPSLGVVISSKISSSDLSVSREITFSCLGLFLVTTEIIKREFMVFTRMYNYETVIILLITKVPGPLGSRPGSTNDKMINDTRLFINFFIAHNAVCVCEVAVSIYLFVYIHDYMFSVFSFNF